MPQANLGDVRIHFRLDGPADAPVLMLGNSLGTTLALWEPQMPVLTRRFRVLRYDSRGHGESSVPAGPYTIDQMGGDALALLDHLGLASVRFCGISLGGMTGMWLGSTAPSRVDRLMLCNTAARMPGTAAWNARIARVNEHGMAAIAETVLALWFSPAFFAANPPEVVAARAMLLGCNAEGYAAACAAVRDMDQRESIRGISVPTLVVAGIHDVSTPPADARFLAERIPGARVVELDAAHISNLERAADFSAALVAFMSE
jgi:3-oxoadipate enol-lactonase